MKNWSVNLETEEYVANRDLIFEDAKKAVLDTDPGCYVNIAVAENHGNPDDYLIPALEAFFKSNVHIHFVDQCGCGGYVYRIVRRAAEQAPSEEAL